MSCNVYNILIILKKHLKMNFLLNFVFIYNEKISI